jgi:hypothetical protein
MSQPSSFEVILRHPERSAEPGHPVLNGSLHWRLDAESALELARKRAATLAAQWYQIEVFQKGDGIAFRRFAGATPYDPVQAIVDFQRTFPEFNIKVIETDHLFQELARLNEGISVHCTVLVPVEHLRMTHEIHFDAFSIYPAVDGDMMKLADHPWRKELYDVKGAERNPNWYPEPDIGLDRLAGLLRYPLIELETDIPVSLIYLASHSEADTAPLVNYVLELADSCLDILRVHFCSHQSLAFTPGRAGRVVDGTSAFYLKPEHPALRSHLYLHVTDVLSVRNNWSSMDMEAYEPTGIDDTVSRILVRLEDRENQGVIRHAIRTIGTSFYLIVPEACFLQLIYALDALAAVEGANTNHRMHIAALTCEWREWDLPGSRSRFQERLKQFSELYSIRNQIVHKGATFASLEADAASATDEMCTLVWLCCERLLGRELTRSDEVRSHVKEILGQVTASPQATARHPPP